MVLIPLLVLALGSAWGEDRPVQGVVWTPPDVPDAAVHDLEEMQAMGVEAVRAPLIEDERLLAAADTLGIQLYQDVPVAHRSARGLAEASGEASDRLAEAMRRAEAYESARHFGLLQFSDTSDPAACAYVERLAEQVREEGPEESEVYYVTPFIEREQCAAAVDFVLLDGRDAEAPLEQLERWNAAHTTEAGWARLGTWVNDDAGPGYRVPRAPEHQARFIENGLSALATAAERARAVFVYRWRDYEDELNPYGRAYGLHRADESARPAAQVVEGFYTGQQTVFAFPAGEAPQQSYVWLMLLGWATIVAVSLMYAREPRFRRTVGRYFRSHSFYQEVVREGREVLPGATLSLLAGAALTVMIIGTVAADLYYTAPRVTLAVQVLPEALGAAVAGWLAAPYAFGLVLAGVYFGALVLWTFVLIGISRWGTQLSMGQGLMLVVWARWPLVLLLMAGLVSPTLEPSAGRLVITTTLAAGCVVSLQATIRTLVDYARVADVPTGLAVAGGLASPLAVALVGGGWMLLQEGEALLLIWHILTRT